MITVANKRNGATGEYIGRPSPLGNPFVIGRDGTREEVVLKYYNWLVKIDMYDHDHPAYKELQRLRALHHAGEDITLVCWCAPLECHGDVIKHFIDEEE